MLERENERIASTGAKSAQAVDQGLRKFMMGVYNYMAGGLLVSGMVAFTVANTALMNMFINSRGEASGFSWILFIAMLATVFSFGWVIRKGTVNQARAVYLLFTVMMGASIAPILWVYTGASMTRVFLISAATFGSMSIYGYVTHRDLTSIGSFLRMGLWGAIIAMIVNMFMQSSAFDYLLSFVIVGIFVGLTAYDTQKIRKMYYSGDSSEVYTKKALMGALELYLDFINLFLALLRILGDRR